MLLLIRDQIRSPWLPRDIVDCGIGGSYRPSSLCSLAGRVRHPYWTKNLATGLTNLSLINGQPQSPLQFSLKPIFVLSSSFLRFVPPTCPVNLTLKIIHCLSNARTYIVVYHTLYIVCLLILPGTTSLKVLLIQIKFLVFSPDPLPPDAVSPDLSRTYSIPPVVSVCWLSSR